MKKSLFFIMILSLLIMKINAQEISEKDNSLIDNFVKSRIAVTKEMIVSDTLQKVLSGTFYKIDAGYSFTDDGASTAGYIFVIKEGALFVLENTNPSMPTFTSLIRKDFFLKSEINAKYFETALDKIYPISWTAAEYKEHLKINDKWYFIRDKFFDSKSGFIVTVDKNSKILSVGYEMEAIKK
jgi:hypothetical protein